MSEKLKGKNIFYTSPPKIVRNNDTFFSIYVFKYIIAILWGKTCINFSRKIKRKWTSQGWSSGKDMPVNAGRWKSM